MLIVKRMVSKMAITRSCRGFSFPMTTPNEMRTLAAASPPSRTLQRDHVHESSQELGLTSPEEVNLDYVLSGPESSEANQEDGELSDNGRDDDGEAYGAVAVPLKEGHQEPETGKQHDVNVNNH